MLAEAWLLNSLEFSSHFWQTYVGDLNSLGSILRPTNAYHL